MQIRVSIFKSTDGGHTWVRKTNGIAGEMGVIFRGFTVDPTNSDIVYAAGEIASFACGDGPGTNSRTAGTAGSGGGPSLL
jgi:hypothetical protein